MRWMFFALLLAVTSCSIPVASEEKNPTLVIATDIVSPADSAFFAEFGKKNGVTVELRKMSADQLLASFNKSKYNTGVDIIMMHHLYDMGRLKRARVLQKIGGDQLPEHAISGTSNTLFGIGIDPFICVTRSDTNIAVNVYNDLARLHYINRLDPASEPQFFAPFEQRMNRGKSFEYIESIVKRQVPDRAYRSDSITAILTAQSLYRQTKSDSSWKNFNTINYPNSSTSGTFHDVLTVGIVIQSGHYELSLKLINWLTASERNRKFNALRGYDSFYPNNRYTPYRDNPEVLLQYHTMIERMLGKME